MVNWPEVDEALTFPDKAVDWPWMLMAPRLVVAINLTVPLLASKLRWWSEAWRASVARRAQSG